MLSVAISAPSSATRRSLLRGPNSSRRAWSLRASEIVNDPNDWSNEPRYIIDLLKRIITVSLETMKIVDSLPELDILE